MANPNPKRRVFRLGFGPEAEILSTGWWAPASPSANPNPKKWDFRLGCASEAEISPDGAMRVGLRAEMIVGVPTIISDSDAHPERKSHRKDSGMRSIRPLLKISRWNFRSGFASGAEMTVGVPTIISEWSPLENEDGQAHGHFRSGFESGSGNSSVKSSEVPRRLRPSWRSQFSFLCAVVVIVLKSLSSSLATPPGHGPKATKAATTN